jgi:hypothetical protein
MNQPVGIKPGRYWHALEDGRVQCDVCPRYCKLHEGQRGLCFVRARQSDQIVLTTYGRSSGFCIDPIEKKPLNHYLPGEANKSPLIYRRCLPLRHLVDSLRLPIHLHSGLKLSNWRGCLGLTSRVRYGPGASEAKLETATEPSPSCTVIS